MGSGCSGEASSSAVADFTCKQEITKEVGKVQVSPSRRGQQQRERGQQWRSRWKVEEGKKLCNSGEMINVKKRRKEGREG